MGAVDLTQGAYQWRLWHLLGIVELRRRYSRSRLGQLWLMLSTAISIGSMSAVWSILWKQPIEQLMPFVGAGMIIWTYMSTVINECTAVFPSHANIYRNQKTNFSVSIYSVVYKNTIVLAHNVLIILALILIFPVKKNLYILQLIPGLLFMWITMGWVGYILGMICARYRDVVQVVGSALQVLFFITPVMWKPEFLGPEYQFIIDYNPFALFLEVLRNPVLGEPVPLKHWIIVSAIALGGALLALPLISRYRRSLIYWI